MGRKIYDVKKNGDSWEVKGRDNQRASVVTDTKAEAVRRAAEIGNNNGNAQVVIRKENGRIQSERTYGNDPYPPKG
ncbi:DUF2188 domain-containing protein [Tenacibaculum dicentrarchi]|uniref:DUF2188 domain-containing protein n=1 Tax=Tenacibaculum dicentrarchi TaxID=669041 RepID=UPI0035170287